MSACQLEIETMTSERQLRYQKSNVNIRINSSKWYKSINE